MLVGADINIAISGGSDAMNMGAIVPSARTCQLYMPPFSSHCVYWLNVEKTNEKAVSAAHVPKLGWVGVRLA